MKKVHWFYFSVFNLTNLSPTFAFNQIGGPYRLDRGHRVHQVSDKAKDEVSASAKLAAKQMAKKALEEKLKRIGMGEEEFNMYKDFSANIQRDVSRLKGILAAVNLRSKERGWIKHQSYGEIDDAKIVDGITGDKYIYKRRGNIEEASFPKEKYLRFVMDVSGSMYRFNGCKYHFVPKITVFLSLLIPYISLSTVLAK